MTNLTLPNKRSIPQANDKSDTPKLTMLDCFCGMGGVSDGYAMEGFDVIGIDIIDAQVKLGYKHKFIQADMLELDGKDFQGYDVIWGSPPCRDFTIVNDAKWKQKKNPERGLILVNGFLKFVEKAKPKIWIMENVPLLRRYLKIKPRQITKIATPNKKRVFWGNFPNFLMPLQTGLPHSEDVGQPFDKMRKWQRAKIPLACSLAFAKACKHKLLEASSQ